MPTLGSVYLESTITRLAYYKQLAERTFAQLADADFHVQPNAASNSIAVIVQHMSGNMLSRWTNVLTEDGEKAWRHRDDEFEPHGATRAEILAAWERGWQCCLDSLRSLREDDLLKTIYIRQEPLLLVDAINRQLAHYPHHVGQILYVGKIIRGDAWTSLSIPKGQSEAYNAADGIKDPAKRP